MGSFFSKGPREQVQVARPLRAGPPVEAKRYAGNQVGMKRRHITASDVRGSKRPRTTTMNNEPKEDEPLQRFCVSCPGIYWLVKKDVTRLLKRVPGLPEVMGVHKISRWEYFFVTFREREAEKGRECLEKYVHKNEALTVRPAELKSARHKKSDIAINESSGRDFTKRDASEVTAPWGDLRYDAQCSKKRSEWAKALVTVHKRMKNDRQVLHGTAWLRSLKTGDPICPMEQGIFCEREEAREFYRNKNEFTIGMSPPSPENGASQITVGYALGMSRDGDFRVGGVSDRCRTTSRIALEVAKIIENVVSASGQPVYDRKDHTGYWRYVTIRNSVRTNQALVIIMVAPAGELSNEKNAAIAHDAGCREMVQNALRSLFKKNPFGLFWQTSDEFSPTPSAIPVEHVYGLSGLEETLLGMSFQVHPNSFFQVNTTMAEHLYGLVRTWSTGGNSGTDISGTVLDICCGTGTIGLSMAKYCKRVIGVDICEDAIKDARINAQRNGVTNAEFVVGPVEKMIAKICADLRNGGHASDEDDECVAVLDPPRDGVAVNVVSAVRGVEGIGKIVYVACRPATAWKNIMALCRPESKKFKGMPFRPVKATGVDLFPHTPHGELVVLLEREKRDEDSRASDDEDVEM